MQTKSRRQLHLVDRPLQLKFIAGLVGVGLFSALLVGFLIYQMFLGLYRALVPLQIHLTPEFLNLLFTAKRNILYAWILSFVGITALGAWVGLLLSHRVAGPLYALRRNLTLAIEEPQGRLPFLRLRKKDEFRELKDAFNEALIACREREKRAMLKIRQIRESLVDLSQNLEIQRDIRERLREIAQPLSDY